MFTTKDEEALKSLEVKYDFKESDIEQPILKPLVKIHACAVPFTMEDIYKYKQSCQSEKGKVNQVKEQLLKNLAEQEERLKAYNEEFGVDLMTVWSDNDFEKLDQFFSAPYLLKIIEAIDVVRYILGIKKNIERHDSDIAYYDSEVARYDEEIARVNAALDIEHLERQYQVQQVVNQSTL